MGRKPHPIGEHMIKYYGTKRTCAMKRSDGSQTVILYIPADWDLDATHRYFFTIRRIDEPESLVIRFPRNLTAVGNGFRIVLDKRYGFQPGEMVVFTVEDEEDIRYGDTRVQGEEGNQDIP